MGCETGTCPSCLIKIGAMPTPLNIGQFYGSDWIQTYHLFILYEALSQTIIYRGGPARGNQYNTLVAQGLAQVFQAPTSEIGDIDWPFDNLITHRKVGIEEDYDYEVWKENGPIEHHMITIAEGPEYCGLDEALTRETKRIGQLGRTYNALDVDRTDNSNATVYTILDELGLPLKKPNVHAPGWGTNLHNEKTLPEHTSESINETISGFKKIGEEVERELNWFENLSPMKQAELLRHMFR